MIAFRIVLLGVIAAALGGPGRGLLMRARWTDRVPRGAILVWQALGGAMAISLIGVCIEVVRLAEPVAPQRRVVTDFSAKAIAVGPSQRITPELVFLLTAALIVGTLVIGAVFICLIGRARARARQRLLVDLLASQPPELPDTLVVSSPRVTAFTLPGFRSRVVVSTGALAALDEEELAAVLAHERAHVRARHDLVLLPFQVLASLVPSSVAIASMRDEVSALVEMAADNDVRRYVDAGALARALCRLATSDETNIALPAQTAVTTRRLEQALTAPPRSGMLACSSVLSAGVLLALPFFVLLGPIGR